LAISRGTRRAAIIALAAFMVPILLIVPALGQAPWVDVISPEDGGWVTDPLLEVRGNASSPSFITDLRGDFLTNGTGFGLDWDGENLSMSPRALFVETFSGSQLDPGKWTVVRNQGVIDVSNGHLHLATIGASREFPLVQSRGAIFSKEMDWIARVDMTYTSQGYSGSGGGISAGSPMLPNSFMAAYNQWVNMQTPRFGVYSNGYMVYNLSTPDGFDHTYSLRYESGPNRYSVLLDATKLDTFTRSDIPSILWFGASVNGPYYQYANIDIDYVDVWAFNGKRTFAPIRFPHETVFDEVNMNWSTTNPAKGVAGLQARSSTDGANWGDWTEVMDGIPEAQLIGEWLQLRVDLSLPALRNTDAKVVLHGIDVVGHHPVKTVELRSNNGRWIDATGTQDWRAEVQLREDLNHIDVRVTDSSGKSNLSFFQQILDTTPPVGSIQILKDRPYTNNLNVTLSLNATDKYGVEYVQVSNSPYFTGILTFPFQASIDWTMGGSDGEVGCYVRFVDTHGLVSEIFSDTIIYDTFPPSGEITINDGDKYSPSLGVDLDLEYSDTKGIATIELSNLANFSDIRTVEVGETTHEDWMMAEGPDGPRTVYMRLTDVSGNVRVVSDLIEYHEPKAVGSLTLVDGADVTNQGVIDVDVSVPLAVRARRMQLSNEPAFIDATWVQLEEQTTWILSPGDGPKVVFLRFLDFRDIVSLPVNATIILDTTPPRIDVIIDGGATYAIDTSVVVEVVYVDALPTPSMWISRVDRFNEIEPQEFTDSFEWELYRQEGPQELFIKVVDLAGNEAIGRSSIHFATILPKVIVHLPDGDLSNSVDQVLVLVDVIDPYGGIEVQISIGEDPSARTEWMANDGVLQIPIPVGTVDGGHPIGVTARNTAGLESELVNVTITLDRTAPSVSILVPVDGASMPQKGFDVLLEMKSSDPSGLALVRFRVDGGDWTLVPDSGLSSVVTLYDFGSHSIEVEVTDGAGNTGLNLTTFDLENSEATVGGGSRMGLLLLIAIAVIVGVAFESYRRRSGGSGRGFLDNIVRHPDDATEPLPVRTDVRADERTDARNEEAPEDDVPSDGGGTDEVDHSGWIEIP